MPHAACGRGDEGVAGGAAFDGFVLHSAEGGGGRVSVWEVRRGGGVLGLTI